MNRLRLMFAAVLASVAAAAAPNALAAPLNNPTIPPGEKPVLGWSSWSFLRDHPTTKNVEAQALAMHTSGLQAAGYEYVNLDDFWYECPKDGGPNVDKYGRWVVKNSAFPSRNGENGIKVLADYVHSLGEKFGIYLTPGIPKRAVADKTKIKGTPYTANQIARPGLSEANYNCGGMVSIDFDKPGAQAYVNAWADMFASWGVDFVKLDGIGNHNVPDIVAWSKAIKQSGRPMLLDITDGIFTTAIMPTLMRYSTQWEMLPDVECYDCEKKGSSYPLTSWANIEKRFQWVSQLQQYSGPGHFNDYDSIEVGNGAESGLTAVERQTQLSLWALGSAPLILGADLTHLDPADLGYLKNAAVLAVDQDAIAARMVANYHEDGPRVFAKTEPDGDVVIGLFNLGNTQAKVSVRAVVVGIPHGLGDYTFENLWTGARSHPTGPTIDAVVPAHGVVLYRATPNGGAQTHGASARSQ